MQWPRCAEAVPDDDVFCEACGARVSAAAAAAPVPGGCPCGAPAEEIDEDGFCERCGHRARRPDSDHIETALSPVCAAVSDIGLRHTLNEDRFAIQAVGDGYAFVVCDGVSASRQSELASSAVSTEVVESLARALKSGPIADSEAVMRQAIAAGEATLAAHPARDAQDNPPSTTVVAALVAEGQVTVGWVGDSRAYWIGGEGARQLTSDHSWMNEVVLAGEMSAAEAEKDKRAHAITHWLGADAGASAAADVARFPLSEPGVLLLCTDGLWNYAAVPEAMAQLVHTANANNAEALGTVRHLVEYAIAQGGQDNVTVVVLLVGQASGPVPA
jgi:serine/threonine protein phosphatase PrpC